MSLQHAAKHLEKHGRNGDTVLVHMSKGEVKSLNDLAMAGGGHLTINPHTGLPEAGFLRSLLPMIAGAALTGLTGGVVNPMTAGLLIGGGTAAATGDIKKGLMAGLGAYGGGGIGSALASSGTQAVAAASPEVLAAQQNAVTNATALGNTASTYSPEAFAEAARATTAPINAAQQTALETAKTQFAAPTTTITDRLGTMGQGVKSLGQPGGLSGFYENLGNVEYTYGPKTTLAAAAAPTLAYAMQPEKPGAPPEITTDKTPAPPLTYEYGMVNPAPAADVPKYGDLGQDFGQERNYFQNAGYRPSTVQERGFAVGGPIEDMSNANSVGANTGYPMADISKGAYATPYQQPISRNMMTGVTDTGVNPITGEMTNFAKGGISHLGDYSDGGRLLRGPGDGVSDSIPAVIGKKQPARLADGEFVVPARIVSELGNGSTEAGARKLYAMMDRIQKARGKTVGKGKVAKNSRSEKHLPA
jgi:hypothetical protein